MLFPRCIYLTVVIKLLRLFLFLPHFRRSHQRSVCTVDHQSLPAARFCCLNVPFLFFFFFFLSMDPLRSHNSTLVADTSSSLISVTFFLAHIFSSSDLSFIRVVSVVIIPLSVSSLPWGHSPHQGVRCRARCPHSPPPFLFLYAPHPSSPPSCLSRLPKHVLMLFFLRRGFLLLSTL